MPLIGNAAQRFERNVRIDKHGSALFSKSIQNLQFKFFTFGSSAVNRYTAMELKDRFALMSAAFDQKTYKVNENLKVVGK